MNQSCRHASPKHYQQATAVTDRTSTNRRYIIIGCLAYCILLYSYVYPHVTPQSVCFCRPLRVCFEKEDVVATLCEFKRLKREISSLKPYNFIMPNKESVRITFNVSQTLFNGKCVNTIVGNKVTSRCPMCLRTAHEFGNLNDDFKPNQSYLIYGLGLLHCTIKCFEHLLHLSYKKDFVLWSVGPDKKGIMLIIIKLM